MFGRYCFSFLAFGLISMSYASPVELKNNDELPVTTSSTIEAVVSLREHQIIGVKQILQWHDKKHGGIVSDEMGLGKTCQAIGAIVCLLRSNNAGRHLIVCPLSVLRHWQDELLRFGLGQLHVITYIGNADARKMIREELRNSNDWNVLLTTYEMVICDGHSFHWTWSSLFVDEAHRLKSKKSSLHRIIREMSVEFMVLLTGTPVQNSISELHSLLSLIDPIGFPLYDQEYFVMKYQRTCDKQIALELQHILSNYLLRRTKQMIHFDIPNRSELIIYHGITEIQKNMYRAILSRNYKYFENMGNKDIQEVGKKMSLLNVLMQLRKCVAHPYLFNGVEPEPFTEGNHLFEVSGKFFLLDRLLAFLAAKGHRVLIFSQMTSVLDIAQDYLTYRGYNYRRLDGSVRAEERFAAINHFQADPDIFCFLLSTRAGGIGLNLTAGDTVIFLDSDFNPQNDIQAAARPVKILRLVARFTVEDMILCRAKRKLKLTREILEENSDASSRLSNEETDLEELNTEKIEQLIGRTDENGHWICDKKEQVESFEAKKEENEEMENMYIFEGHDYKQDLEVLRSISAESKSVELAEVSSVRGTIVKQMRKRLSKSEIEERQKKRKETLERKKKLKDEIEQKKNEQKMKKWLQSGYKSGSLPLREVDEIQDTDINPSYGPYFVYGSVTDAQKAPTDNSDCALIIHVVDDSGVFGCGGVFDALREKSQQIIKTYELAGKMGDLHLGDAHLIEDIASEFPITPLRQSSQCGDNDVVSEADQSDLRTCSKWKISVVLLVAQHHRKRDSIDHNVLSECLKKVAFYATNSNIRSVHMPRIGYNMKNISWYMIERLIRRILVSRGIHTYVYYSKGKTNSANGSITIY
uniref:Uncharacterized protein n=1 Tax=Setaria digitata TaxID=48799 RepID=A0A915PGC4_9BILA